MGGVGSPRKGLWGPRPLRALRRVGGRSPWKPWAHVAGGRGNGGQQRQAGPDLVAPGASQDGPCSLGCGWHGSEALGLSPG